MAEQLKLGEVLRDLGINRAIASAENINPKWGLFALDYLKRYPKQVFLTEQVREWAYKKGLPKAPSARAWGAVIREARKENIIKHIGFRNVENPKAHRTPASLWSKQIK